MPTQHPRRIPLALKVAVTLWLAVWAPVYGIHWGLPSFLWFCNLGTFVIVAGIWRESRLLVSWQAVSLLAVQFMWLGDFTLRLFFGVRIGGTEYMFDPKIPLGLRLLSLYHAVIPWLLLWLLRRLGYDGRGLRLQLVATLVVLPAGWLFGPDWNLNWTWGPFDKAQARIAPGLYLAATMAAYPLLLYMPTHWVLGWRERRR